MQKDISENKLAEELGFCSATLRQRRNEFKNMGVSLGQGKSVKFNSKDIFNILLCNELIRYGTDRDEINRILNDKKINTIDEVLSHITPQSTDRLYRTVYNEFGICIKTNRWEYISDIPPEEIYSKIVSFCIIDLRRIWRLANIQKYR